MFLVLSPLLVLALLGFQFYMSSFVYVVLLDDQEVGIVENASEVEHFVSSLTERCEELYGIKLEPGKKISLTKEFRPDSKPASEPAQSAIRQQISFMTDAYLINVDGKPFVPVASEEVLTEVVNSLKTIYSSNDGASVLVDAFVVEELALDQCHIPLESLFTAEEVVSLLAAGNGDGALMASALKEPGWRGSTGSRYNTDRDLDLNFPPGEENDFSNGEYPVAEGIKVHVVTEELIAFHETIPYLIEYIEPDGKYKTGDIVVPGEDGLREVVYQIIRENGIEMERLVVSDNVLQDPVNQVEAYQQYTETVVVAAQPAPSSTPQLVSPGIPQLKKIPGSKSFLHQYNPNPVISQSGSQPVSQVSSTPAPQPVKLAASKPVTASMPQIRQLPVNQFGNANLSPAAASSSSSAGSGSFIWPVQGQGIIYPGQGFRPGHTGIDIHIDHGTAVLAADSGVVTFNGYGSTQGNYLIIHHGRYWTLYLHNSVNLVKVGERVSKGQVIARVGTTGRAIGAHLHFEIRRDDGTGVWNRYYQHQPIDPLQFYNRKVGS
jgi:hypothetical protein